MVQRLRSKPLDGTAVRVESTRLHSCQGRGHYMARLLVLSPQDGT